MHGQSPTPWYGYGGKGGGKGKGGKGGHGRGRGRGRGRGQPKTYKKPTGQKNDAVCWNCGGRGHKRDQCPSATAEPEGGFVMQCVADVADRESAREVSTT